MKNYYDILGLKNTATVDEIRTAFRKLSHKFHPDKNDGEEFFADMFKQILEAYSVLINTEKRKEYDRKLLNDVRAHNSESYSRHQTAKAPSPSPTKRTQAVTVWTSVEQWKKRRNMVAILNIILVLVIFLLPRKSSSNSPENSSKLQEAPVEYEFERPEPISEVEETVLENVEVDTLIDTNPQQNNTNFTEHIDENPQESLKVESQVYVDSAKISKEEIKPKRRGLLKRIFGKRKKDTI